ncbi:MAG TPA: hypothetical protein DIW31_02030 [Bacteroidales bacterium]|nr:hypothetical protein [Bacteroidales bacterium]
MANPEIKIKTEKVLDEYTVILTALHPAFDVQISSEAPDFKVENNYFNILPGKEYRVKILVGNDKEIEVKSLYDYINK